jgi:hypothetical protein
LTKPTLQITTAPQFATLLGIGVTSMKRHFERGILPEYLVQKRRGAHWRVRYSNDDLRRCKAALAIWCVWRRKPRASRLHARRDELLTLAIDLIIFDVTRPTPRTAAAQYKRTFCAVRLLSDASDDVSGVRWRNKLLDQPNELFAAVFILRAAVFRFRAKWKRDPKATELADTLGISTASLYRAPFGKAALRLAKLDRDILESEGDRSHDTKASEEPNADHPLNTDQLSDTDADLSPEDRRNKKRRELPAGVHEVPKRKDDSMAKKVRKQRAKTLEMEWETDGRGGAMLCVFRAESLALKRLNKSINDHAIDGNTQRESIRKSSRTIRKALNMDSLDPTFGCQCWAAYATRTTDSLFDWWLNIDMQPHGVTDSASNARREILTRMARVKARNRIFNLSEIVGAG